MKKIFTIFAFMLVAFTGNAQSTQKGDVNGDGDISVNDVAMIVNYILGITDSNFIIANADINGDGEIDINDVMGTVSTILEGNGGGGNGSGIGDTSQAYLTCPNDNHPHIIDLGLPSGTKWACCNVGASSPEEYGGYYAWGETREKSVYNEVTYQYATGVDEDGDGYYDYHEGWQEDWQNIGDDIAGTQYDVAHVKWGGSWVMPSHTQILELLCWIDDQRTTVNGVSGAILTNSNGGSIFLPAAGQRWFDELWWDVGGGFYWSSTQSPSASDAAYYLEIILSFDSDNLGGMSDTREWGRSVRPVWVP